MSKRVCAFCNGTGKVTSYKQWLSPWGKLIMKQFVEPCKKCAGRGAK